MSVISVLTDNGTIEFTPSGDLLKVLEERGSVDERLKLQEHIQVILERAIKELMRFSLGSEESIEAILNPERALKNAQLSSNMWDDILNN